ncbi:MAG: hypothetical protein ABH836_01485 [Candidatus Omnitrophota bacterium]
MQSEKEHFNARVFFKEVVKADKLASCYFFAGEDHFKKIETARYLAKLLNCLYPESDENCRCDNCIKIDSFNHPDVIWIKSSSGQKLKIESVRMLIRRIYLKPYMARRKVFVIENAELLTEEAQNAFLKTLEDSSRDSVIILMAGQKELLLETIISRCQTIKFLSVREDKELDSFAEEFLFAENRFEIIAEFLKKIERHDLDKILGDLLAWFRNLLIYKHNKEISANGENVCRISKDAERYSCSKLENIIKELIALKDMVNQNVNVKLVLSNLALVLEE